MASALSVSGTFGTQTLEPYDSKKCKILTSTIYEIIRMIHTRNLMNPNILKQYQYIVVPRYGGRVVFLWLKGKNRVWIDNITGWISTSIFPADICDGTLLMAEMFLHNGIWYIAWEDLLVKQNKSLIPETPYLQRLRELQTIADLIGFHTHPHMDPGIMIMKPIVNPYNIKSLFNAEKFIIQPKFLLLHNIVDFVQHPFLYKVYHTKQNDDMTGINIYEIRKKSDTKDPDQFDLLDTTTKEYIGDACIRSMNLSLWLRDIKDGTHVLCRRFQDKWEPFSPAYSRVASDRFSGVS
jgi:hypothetical protein